jgi:hypothetical protein
MKNHKVINFITAIIKSLKASSFPNESKSKIRNFILSQCTFCQPTGLETLDPGGLLEDYAYEDNSSLLPVHRRSQTIEY